MPIAYIPINRGKPHSGRGSEKLGRIHKEREIWYRREISQFSTVARLCLRKKPT